MVQSKGIWGSGEVPLFDKSVMNVTTRAQCGVVVLVFVATKLNCVSRPKCQTKKSRKRDPPQLLLQQMCEVAMKGTESKICVCEHKHR